jgi:hypothetical protein
MIVRWGIGGRTNFMAAYWTAPVDFLVALSGSLLPVVDHHTSVGRSGYKHNFRDSLRRYLPEG